MRLVEVFESGGVMDIILRDVIANLSQAMRGRFGDDVVEVGG